MEMVAGHRPGLLDGISSKGQIKRVGDSFSCTELDFQVEIMTGIALVQVCHLLKQAISYEERSMTLDILQGFRYHACCMDKMISNEIQENI